MISRKFSAAFAATLLMLAVAHLFGATSASLSLDGAWTVRESGSAETLPATVPGNVHTDLLAAKKIPDPFYRDNEARLQWIGEKTWVYARSFDVPADFLKHQNVTLLCEGLDTLATVTVNGKEIARTDNQFRTYEWDVRDILRPGENTIEISFAPTDPYRAERKDPPAFPGHVLEERGTIRKEQCDFGWDWGPKLVTCGIWRPISLVAWNDARLDGVLVMQDHMEDGRVILDVDTAVDTNGKISLQSEVTVSFEGQPIASKTQPLRQDGVGRTTLEISEPRIWWPAGMGEQPLYDVHVKLRDDKGAVLDGTTKRIGLRTIEWLAKSDSRPLGLAVNGRPFFAKGSNWIPPEVFPNTVTKDLLRRYMEDAVASNMNMLRFWGGGYYEEDELFDLCDELGILVWMDFKFSCYAYPSYDPAFRENVRAECRDNILRLRHHPSIAVWCGNNEVRQLAAADRWKPEFMSDEDYDILFKGVIPGVLKELDPQAVYTPGSPEAGDDHYWQVWHGGRPLEDYTNIHGMMTEFGFQSFAEPRTVAAYTTPEDRESVHTDVMRWHQRNGGVPSGPANHRIVGMTNRYFRPAKDFDSALWLSQLVQANGIGRAIEHWRRDWPRSTGSLVWQLNDCWPVTSWSSIDYFGRWKALQYRLKHAYEPLLVSATTNPSGRAEVFVSSDLFEPVKARLDWIATDTHGTTLDSGSRAIEVPAGTCTVPASTISLETFATEKGAKDILLWLELSVDGKTVSKNMMMFAKPKWIDLQDPEITATVEQVGDAFEVTLAAKRPALWAWLEFGDLEVRYSDNFFHLRPGATEKVTVTPAEKGITLDQLRQNLRVRSVVDTFDPAQPFNEVFPSGDGSLVALAAGADIEGSIAHVDIPEQTTLVDWSRIEDYAQWKLAVKTPGKYRVSVKASCDAAQAGSKFDVTVGDQTLSAKVPATKSPEEFADIDLGTVTIDEAGTTWLKIQPTSKAKDFVMNLRSVTLTPES